MIQLGLWMCEPIFQWFTDNSFRCGYERGELCRPWPSHRCAWPLWVEGILPAPPLCRAAEASLSDSFLTLWRSTDLAISRAIAVIKWVVHSKLRRFNIRTLYIYAPAESAEIYSKNIFFRYNFLGWTENLQRSEFNQTNYVNSPNSQTTWILQLFLLVLFPKYLSHLTKIILFFFVLK